MTYRRLHQLLADEVGVEPGPAVQELHRQIPAAQAEPDGPSDTSLCRRRSRRSRYRGSCPPTSRRLPAGRTLTDLDRIPDANAVVITAIDGMAGVGKT
jgi:hypothetical protein